MRETTRIMKRHADDALAAEPFGTKLREQPDIKGTNKQPSLQCKEIRSLVDVLAPTASPEFARAIDQKALPEVLKCIAEGSYADLESCLWKMFPDAQEYSPHHGDEAKAGGQGGGDAAAGGGHGGEASAGGGDDVVQVKLGDGLIGRPAA